MEFSEKLITKYSKTPKILERIELGMRRIQNVLETNIVCCQKTLEQKISDQGPKHQRVDPQLLGASLEELITVKKFVKKHTHTKTNTHWYANARKSKSEVEQKIKILAPIYNKVTTGGFPNLIGDALEIVTYKSLLEINSRDKKFGFNGQFDFETKDQHGRYKKYEPTERISGQVNKKIPDFYLHGHSIGTICIECKNKREWLYPSDGIIKQLIIKSLNSNTQPLLIHRRIHYSTMTNLLAPAGILAHETYNQFYPTDDQDLIEKVKNKNSLGFSDIIATEEHNPRTTNFLESTLPNIADEMNARFTSNINALEDYVNENINLAQLYNKIGSPAAGNWTDDEIEDIPF